MRRIVVVLVLTGVLGFGSPWVLGTAAAAPAVGSTGARLERIEAQLLSISDDVTAILQSFAGGVDSSRSPVNDSHALSEARGRLDAASEKARNVATEVQHLRDETPRP